MDYRLGTAAEAAGYRLAVHDSLGSTNTEALERARCGEVGPLWVLARSQGAGRGRRGNAWTSPPGSLAASLLVAVDDVDPGKLATLGFVAGVALVDALEQRCGAGFTLKWPNDVLLGGVKLAGILLEAETLRTGRRIVVIGFGVNVAASPEGLPYAATCLRQGGYALSAEDVFAALSDTIVDALGLWRRGDGFPDVRARWIARAAGIDAPVTVRLGDERVQGIFETIDEAGRLVVASDDGTRRTVTAGEVHFGTAATAA
ncbi:biotin--[acetyl-CoA-carboxylase] ligase [uncultured Methylobacterium sp.]|uniref:biotin--[acetyl-CoA-carboxylase] ligase n=1 Tax=uncultured Methylobacterium sp. TaxID=157278 RepID=UPI0035CC07B5